MPVENKKSQLKPLGIILMIIGIIVPRPLWNFAESLPTGNSIKGLTFLFTDLFRLCFFIGLIVLIIGFVRGKKSNQAK